MPDTSTNIAQANLIFLPDKSYIATTACDIVRAIERDTVDYPHTGAQLRTFLRWSLVRLSSRIPRRELGLEQRVNDETLALSFLLLLDEYGIGKLQIDTTQTRDARYRFET